MLKEAPTSLTRALNSNVESTGLSLWFTKWLVLGRQLFRLEFLNARPERDITAFPYNPQPFTVDPTQKKTHLRLNSVTIANI